VKTTFRPMTARERKELEGYISWIPLLARTMMFAAAVAVVAAFAAALQAGLEQLLGGRSLGPLWAIPTMAVAAILFSQSRKWTGGPELRRRFIADLVRGEVAVHHVVVSAALEIPEVEDEGPTFFVRDADGETLFFAGQFLERLEQRGFPWTEFKIQEAPVSKHFYGVRAEGPRFEGTRILPALAHAQMKQMGLFARSWGKLDISLSDLERGGES
jgi:hypothetical protein